MSQHSHSHEITIQALDKQYTFTMVAVFRSHMIFTFNIHSQLPTSKANGEAKKKVTSHSHMSYLTTSNDSLNDRSQYRRTGVMLGAVISLYDHATVTELLVPNVVSKRGLLVHQTEAISNCNNID